MIGPASPAWPIAPLRAGQTTSQWSLVTMQSERRMNVESLVSLLEFLKWSLVVGS